jgi:hypothetical protein
MRVERGQSALVAVAEPGDAAAQAFERLEVSLKGTPYRDAGLLRFSRHFRVGFRLL